MNFNPRKNKKIIIAFVIDFLATRDGLTGGTERQLIELVNHLDPDRFRPMLFCLQEFVNVPLWGSIKCEKYVLDVYSLASVQGLRSLASFVRFLHRNKVDIVQTYFHDSTIFGVSASTLAGVKNTITCRRDAGFWHGKTLLKNLSLTNRFTDRILVNCNAVKEAVTNHEHVNPNKIDVIHNGLELQAFDMQAPVSLQDEYDDIEKEDTIIGMVANYNREVKRADLFIMAASEVLKHYKNVKFLLIGEGKLEGKLKKLIRELNLDGRVILGGKKDPAIPYIKSFDIGVLTSDSEGFSNVLLEYMAAGIPVVATDVGGNGELVVHSQTGFLAKKGDPQDMSRAICLLLLDRMLAAAMGRRGREIVEEKYSWHVCIEHLQNYYTELVG